MLLHHKLDEFKNDLKNYFSFPSSFIPKTNIWYSFIFIIIFDLLLYLILGGLDEFIPKTFKNNLEVQLTKKSIIFIILGISLFPAVEEFIYRSFIKGRDFEFMKYISFLLTLFVFYNSFIEINVKSKLDILIFIFVVIILIYFFIKTFFKNKTIFLSLLSIFGFSLIHISNYKFTSNQFIYIPLLIYPQLLLSTILVFIRTGYGLRYSILFHCIHNFIYLLIYFAFFKN